jgi:hypothetical protein
MKNITAYLVTNPDGKTMHVRTTRRASRDFLRRGFTVQPVFVNWKALEAFARIYEQESAGAAPLGMVLGTDRPSMRGGSKMRKSEMTRRQKQDERYVRPLERLAEILPADVRVPGVVSMPNLLRQAAKRLRERSAEAPGEDDE